MITFKKFLLLLIGVLLYSSLSFAQKEDKVIDSLFFLASATADSKTAIKIADRAFLLAKKNKDKVRMGNCLLIKVIKYCDGADFQEALKLFPETERLAQEHKNYSFLTQLYTIKGNIYSTLGFFDESRTLLHQASGFAKKIDESEIKHYRLGMIYNALAVNTEKSNLPIDTVHYYNKLAFNEGKAIVKDKNLKTIKSLWADNLGTSFLKRKQIDSAEHYLNEALMAGKLDRDTLIMGMVYKNLGDLYLKKENNAIALKFFKEALHYASTVNNAYSQKDAYLGLAEVYKNIGDLSLSAEFYERHQVLSDSLDQAEKLAMKVPLMNLTDKISKAAQEKESHQMTLLVITVLIIVLIITVVAYPDHRFGKSKTVQRKTDQKELSKPLLEIKKQVDPVQLSLLLKLTKNRDASFIIKFHEIYPDFKNRLLQKVPTLTPNEIELCAYIHMNFDNKEIARYTNTSLKSVESRKYRIKRKLGLSQDDNLNFLLMEV